MPSLTHVVVAPFPRPELSSSVSIRPLAPQSAPETPPARRRRRRWLWGVAVLAGVLLVGMGPTAVSRPLVQLGLPLALIVGLLHWRIRRWRQRAEAGRKGPYWFRVAQTMWRPQGSGFYALVAAVTFLGLQGETLLDRGHDLWTTWHAAPYADGGAFVEFLSGQLWGGVFEVIVAVSVETVLNVVWAGLWPLSWVQQYDLLTAVGAMVLAYAVYRGARSRLPVLDAVMQRVEAQAEAYSAPEDPEVGIEQEGPPERHDGRIPPPAGTRSPHQHG